MKDRIGQVIIVALIGTLGIVSWMHVYRLMFIKKPVVIVSTDNGLPWMYSQMRSDGRPFVINGKIDTARVHQASRFNMIVEPAKESLSLQAQILMKHYNRQMMILGFIPAGRFYVCGDTWYGGEIPYGCDTSSTNLRWSLYKVVRAYNGILMGKNGPYSPNPRQGGFYIDYSNALMASAMGEEIAAWINSNDIYSGAFLDEMSKHILWTQTLRDSINYRHSGFGNIDDWDTAYGEGIELVFAKVRERIGDKLLVGNGGPYGPKVCNGWTRENFAHQNGGYWSTNMLGWKGVPDDVGYLGDTTYTKPVINFLFAWPISINQNDNQKLFSYVYCSSKLGTGFGCVTGDSTGALDRGYRPWWFSYYDIKLGKPKGVAYSKSKTQWAREYENYTVLVDTLLKEGAIVP